MIQEPTVVTFHLTCPEPRAWLVLKSETPQPRVVEMRRQFPNDWSATASLVPGEYRCRYYCGDDRHVNYYGPAHIDGGTECGMDTLVSVKSPEEKRSP